MDDNSDQMMKISTFQYSPLETPSTIRLVHVPPYDPSCTRNNLELTLHHVEISQVRKKYDALSYVWGDDKKMHTINVNGRSFQVRENLMFYLRRVCRNPLLLWIDALCLNQDDKAEKSQQILRMREIYENAGSVLAELGPIPVNEEVDIERMNQISSLICTQLSEGCNSIEEIQLPLEFADPCVAHFWEGMARVLDHPWWQRVWIMQEATAVDAGHTVILRGDQVLSLEDIIWCIVAMYRGGTSISWMKCFDLMFQVTTVIQLSIFREIRVHHLLDVLQTFRGLAATDPRDIVFAALNIADTGDSSLQPDYGKTVLQTYQATTVHCLRDSRYPLEVLTHCSWHPDRMHFGPDWPSWVPHWQIKMQQMMFGVPVRDGRGHQHRLYDPCDIRSFSFQRYPIRIRDHTLILHGIVVDQLAQLNRSCDADSLDETVDIVQSWMPEDPLAYYFAGETLLDAFLRTIVADVDLDAPGKRGGKAKLILDEEIMTAHEIYRHNERISRYSSCRRLAYSTKGYMALVSNQAKEDDVLCTFFGGTSLYLLRPKGDEYLLMGECYVHGLMDGEVLQLVQRGEAEMKLFTIV